MRIKCGHVFGSTSRMFCYLDPHVSSYTSSVLPWFDSFAASPKSSNRSRTFEPNSVSTMFTLSFPPLRQWDAGQHRMGAFLALVLKAQVLRGAEMRSLGDNVVESRCPSRLWPTILLRPEKSPLPEQQERIWEKSGSSCTPLYVGLGVSGSSGSPGRGWSRLAELRCLWRAPAWP